MRSTPFQSEVREGLRRAKNMKHSSIVVVGHPEYYLKFGFKPASLFLVKAPFEVPDDAFMALELRQGGLKDIKGVIEYPKPYYDAL